MTAPELSAAEARRVEAIEAAPDAEEAIVERVARAIHAADFVADPHVPWGEDVEGNREDYRNLARAAIAALASPDLGCGALEEDSLLTAADNLAELAEAARVLDDTVTAYMLGVVDGAQVSRAQRPVRIIVHRLRAALGGRS